jgi:stringent starvation protein B
MSTAKMSALKPYLIRAYYDWVVDNDLTPYLSVNANYPGLSLPEKHIVDGKITLNISPVACRGLHLDNDRIVFSTKFSGIAIQVVIIPAAVLAIYAKENGEGIQFPEEKNPPPTPSSTPPRKKPNLKLV